MSYGKMQTCPVCGFENVVAGIYGSTFGGDGSHRLEVPTVMCAHCAKPFPAASVPSKDIEPASKQDGP